MKRMPAVAGQFYHSSPSRLKSQVGQYVIKNTVKEKAIGVVSPHAGLIYSGHVAGAVYSSIEFPQTFILIGPNHTGLGTVVSIMSSGSWEMPMREIFVDENVSKKIIKHLPFVEDDPRAHRLEHSLEVQLPFIAYFSDSAKIVPIAVMKASLRECQQIGKGIAEAIKESDMKIVIVASSDMSHYVPDSTARRLDKLALDNVISLNPEGLYNIVMKESISMCGYLPTTIMLYAALHLGAKEAKLIKYATSAEVSGDYDHVVGYAGVIVK